MVIKDCTARNFRISTGTARGAFSPRPRFIFKHVTRTPPQHDFDLFQHEWSLICLHSALTAVPLLHFYFNAQMPVILEYDGTLRTSEVILAFEERHEDIECQVCKRLPRFISGREQPRRSPRKSSRWDLFPKPDCVASIRWGQPRITSSLRKNNDPGKPEMFYFRFDCYHLS
jgi:hypothetical protein